MLKTALIVDDSPELCELFKIAFESVGFRVTTAANGNQALAHIQKQHPDIMTLDVDMPGMSGLTVLREMKNNPETANIKVILATGNDIAYMHEDTELADLILLKPVGFKQLLKLAQRLISAESQAQQCSAS